jgi:hypothetical protein
MSDEDARVRRTKEKLYAAVERLKGNNVDLLDGKISPTALAKEAGVGRATVYRHPDVLDYINSIQLDGPDAISPSERIRSLEAEVARLRKEDSVEQRRLRGLNDRYAQHIQMLTLALHAEIEKSSSVDKRREQQRDSLLKAAEVRLMRDR